MWCGVCGESEGAVWWVKDVVWWCRGAVWWVRSVVWLVWGCSVVVWECGVVSVGVQYGGCGGCSLEDMRV